MLSYILLFSQLLNFSIKGTVTDSKTNEPIEGAVVVLVEENKNVSTNATGNFEIADLSAGTNTLEIKFLESELML